MCWTQHEIIGSLFYNALFIFILMGRFILMGAHSQHFGCYCCCWPLKLWCVLGGPVLTSLNCSLDLVMLKATKVTPAVLERPQGLYNSVQRAIKSQGLNLRPQGIVIVISSPFTCLLNWCKLFQFPSRRNFWENILCMYTSTSKNLFCLKDDLGTLKIQIPFRFNLI